MTPPPDADERFGPSADGDARKRWLARHLEGRSVAETAAPLGLAVGTVKTRHLRALTRLRHLLELPGEQHS